MCQFNYFSELENWTKMISLWVIITVPQVTFIFCHDVSPKSVKSTETNTYYNSTITPFVPLIQDYLFHLWDTYSDLLNFGNFTLFFMRRVKSLAASRSGTVLLWKKFILLMQP